MSALELPIILKRTTEHNSTSKTERCISLLTPEDDSDTTKRRKENETTNRRNNLIIRVRKNPYASLPKKTTKKAPLVPSAPLKQQPAVFLRHNHEEMILMGKEGSLLKAREQYPAPETSIDPAAEGTTEHNSTSKTEHLQRCTSLVTPEDDSETTARRKEHKTTNKENNFVSCIRKNPYASLLPKTIKKEAPLVVPSAQPLSSKQQPAVFLRNNHEEMTRMGGEESPLKAREQHRLASAPETSIDPAEGTTAHNNTNKTEQLQRCMSLATPDDGSDTSARKKENETTNKENNFVACIRKNPYASSFPKTIKKEAPLVVPSSSLLSPPPKQQPAVFLRKNPYDKNKSKKRPMSAIISASTDSTKRGKQHAPAFPSCPKSCASSSKISSSSALHNNRNPYAKKRPKTIDTLLPQDFWFRVSYPRLATCGSNLSKQTFYEDIRARYILAFWRYSRRLVARDKNASSCKVKQFCERINTLALSRFPIRSLDEYCQRENINQQRCTDRQRIEEALRAGEAQKYSAPPSSGSSCKNNKNNNGDGSYYSVAEACLVSMLSYVQDRARRRLRHKMGGGVVEVEMYLDRQIKDGDLRHLLQQKESWISLANLIPMIDHRLKDTCPGKLRIEKHGRLVNDNGASYHLDRSSTTKQSVEFQQIEKLQCKSSHFGDSYIKIHRQANKLVCHYELTTLGYKTALRVKYRTFPERCCPNYRTSNLYRIDPRHKGVCLAIDYREGGGPKINLHGMCNKLDTFGIPYVVCTLNIGDYCFFATTTTDNTAGVAGNNNNKLFPVLVERKSIEDVAHSIYDGRWNNQKRRMYQGQYVFGYDKCRMVYIIEGDKEAHQLPDGCIGQSRFGVTRDRLDDEIDNLKSEGFDVIRTRSPQHSMVELSNLAERILKDHRSGSLPVQYTYEEFKKKVAKIPHQTDFSRIAKDMAKNRVSKEELPLADNENKQATNDGDVVDNNNKTLTFRKATAEITKSSEGEVASTGDNNGVDNQRFDGWSQAQLQKQCEEWGLSKSGKKTDLVARLLNGPRRMPRLFIQRTKQKEAGYTPKRCDSCAAAVLVAMWLKQQQRKQNNNNNNNWKGMWKNEIYPLAERLGISRDPFSVEKKVESNTTGRYYKYDGWSCVKSLRSGTMPLVVLEEGRYKLTADAGVPIAEAMHRWCHEKNVCSCAELGYKYVHHNDTKHK